MPKTVPDRLCAQKGSRFYRHNHPAVCISIDGVNYTGRIWEYCISAGWARVISITNDGEIVAGADGAKRPRIQWKHGRVMVWFHGDPVPEGALLPVSAAVEPAATAPQAGARGAEPAGDSR